MNQSIETYRRYALPVRHTIAQNLPYKVSVQSPASVSPASVSPGSISPGSISSGSISSGSVSVQNTMASFSHPTSNSLPSHFITCSSQFLQVCPFFTLITVTKYGAPDGFSCFSDFERKLLNYVYKLMEQCNNCQLAT